jgi:hypothetical protein
MRVQESEIFVCCRDIVIDFPRPSSIGILIPNALSISEHNVEEVQLPIRRSLMVRLILRHVVKDELYEAMLDLPVPRRPAPSKRPRPARISPFQPQLTGSINAPASLEATF